MQRRQQLLLIGAIITFVVAGWLAWHRMNSGPGLASAGGAGRVVPPPGVEARRGSRGAALIGETILAHYGDPARPPEEDLMWMARALDNFSLLVKGDCPLPSGANEEIARALLGKNRAQLRYLSGAHSALNNRGQLVDRWGSPLYFHPVSSERLDIRSAGPDRIMWTADDIHRRHDGRFLHGDELLAKSLFESPAPRGR